MRPGRPQPSRPGVAGLLAAGFLVSAFTPACSDAGSAEVAEARARIEAEFGPRDAPARPATTGDAAAGQGEPRVEEADEAGGAAPSEDAPVPAPQVPDPEGAEPVGVDDEPGPADDDAGQVSVDSLLALANSAYASLDRLKAAFEA